MPICGCCALRSTALPTMPHGTSEALCLEFSDLLELEPQIDLEISGFEIG